MEWWLTDSSSISVVKGLNPGLRPCVKNLVVAYRCQIVYSAESYTNSYVLVSSVSFLQLPIRVHGGTVLTHSPPTSEVGGSNPGPYVGKLVIAYQWSALYRTEP